MLLKANKRFRPARDRSAGPLQRTAPVDMQRGRSVPPRPAEEMNRHDFGDESARKQRTSPKVRSQSPSRRHQTDHRNPPEFDGVQPSRAPPRQDPTRDNRHDGALDSEGYAPRADRKSPNGQGQGYAPHADRKSPHGQGQERRQQPPLVQNDINAGGDPPPMPGGMGLPTDAFDEEPVELIKCEGCGRKFKEEALERHAKICKSVFRDKRKAFNSAANRLGELEGADKLIQNAKVIGKEAKAVSVEQKEAQAPNAGPGGGRKSPTGDNRKAVPAWKKKSLEFRAAMLASKASTGDKEAVAKEADLRQQLAAAGGNDPANDPSKMQCPHCGRTFNKEAGQRHIDICLKTFGGKKGGAGRLVRGGGKNASIVAAAASVPTAARNDASAKSSAPRPKVGSRPTADEQPRRASNDSATRASSRGPPPLPGGRGDNPPSRERGGPTRR